ncbi:hypothetical protein PS645_05335 [Pseudomonas fluorescens]|uniref:Uncharacterized protein n=1 Tax=Pseudomonas fluorescens TaxID=294 RepID=A0A5E6XER3_PSEFL|nr:hypothetical protein PS645_05335 [Pseudomonas fluorescens]
MPTVCPVFEPVSPVDLILVEQVSQALGELIAFTQIGVIRKEALQGFEVRLIDQLRQQTHEAPGQRGFIKQGFDRDFISTQHHAVQLPHEAARQLHVNGCGNAASARIVFLRIFRERQLQPLRDTVALYQSNFVFQGSQRVAPHPADHQAAQLVQAVTVNHHKTSIEGRCVRHKGFLGKYQKLGPDLSIVGRPRQPNAVRRCCTNFPAGKTKPLPAYADRGFGI